MDNLNHLLKAKVEKIDFYAERADGLRQKLGEAPDLITGQQMLAHCIDQWERLKDRTVTRIDNLSAAFLFKDTLVHTCYIEPLPDRPTHKGDLRIDRKVVKRKPIA